MTNRVFIFDTTLRDGEQSPGATLTLKEKIAVASMLDAMGIDIIEAGFAASSEGDAQCIEAVGKAVKNARVCSLARAITGDIEAAARALENAPRARIHTFVSTSDIHIEHQLRKTRDQVLEIIQKTVTLARRYCEDVEWSAMDATRSDMDFLMKAVSCAIESGAKTINLPDTVGYSVPEIYGAMFEKMTARFPDVCFSVHCHDDLGLAAANSLAGVRGGARQIECTINGIGERAGNAPLEEVVMALSVRKDYFGCKTGIDASRIYPTSRFVAAVTGFPIPKNKAIVGSNAFAHESGIHQDGMLKNRETYEIMRPESVGLTRSQLVMGKHSGRAAFKSKLEEINAALDDEAFEACFLAFKNLCDRKKNVTEEDLMSLVHDYHSKGSSSFVRLINFTLAQDDEASYTAKTIMDVDGKEKTATASGNGPLDAIFTCINQSTGLSPALDSFEAHSVSQGCDAQAESIIVMTEQGQTYTGHARNTDTIIAAAHAYVGAINKILAKGK